ncbi:MAG: histidine kinase [Rhodoferax sp.]|nr:MAG: histidine kinase [Rhodoferax sp.]
MVEQQYVALNDPAQFGAVVQAWGARWPSMGLFVMLPEQEKQHVPWIQGYCRDHGIALMGAVFPALVAQGGFVSEGAWLVCFAEQPDYLLQTDLQGAGAQALEQWTRTTLAGSKAPQTLFFIFDAMVPNVSTLLGNLHMALDSAPRYAGVSAGSETFTPMPCLFDAQRHVGDGVLVIALGEQARTVVQHAYPVSKTLMNATAAQGNRIIRINDRPAFEVYQEVIAQEYGVALTADNFYDYAVHFPFGAVTVVDVLVRIPVALGEDQSLVCVGEISPNTNLRLLRAPELAQSHCVAQLDAALRSAGRPAGSALMTFYCAGRRMHFGGESALEVQQLQETTVAQALFGALSLGEIDSVEDLDVPRFHNAAMVCIAA